MIASPKSPFLNSQNTAWNYDFFDFFEARRKGPAANTGNWSAIYAPGHFYSLFLAIVKRKCDPPLFIGHIVKRSGTANRREHKQAHYNPCCDMPAPIHDGPRIPAWYSQGNSTLLLSPLLCVLCDTSWLLWPWRPWQEEVFRLPAFCYFRNPGQEVTSGFWCTGGTNKANPRWTRNRSRQ